MQYVQHTIHKEPFFFKFITLPSFPFVFSILLPLCLHYATFTLLPLPCFFSVFQSLLFSGFVKPFRRNVACSTLLFGYVVAKGHLPNFAPYFWNLSYCYLSPLKKVMLHADIKSNNINIYNFSMYYFRSCSMVIVRLQFKL